MKVSIHRLLQKLRGKKKLKLKAENVAKCSIPDVAVISGLGAGNLLPATPFDNVNDFDIHYKGKTIKASNAPKSLIEEMAKAQQRQEIAQFQVEVLLKKAQVDAELQKARAALKQEAQAYKNIMGYPGTNTNVEDIYGNVYAVETTYEHRGLVSPELRVHHVPATGMNLAHVKLQWVAGKVDMGIRFGDADLWPDPNQPLMYCYVDAEDQVYVGIPEHGSVFSSSRPLGSKNHVMWKKVQSWENEGNNIYALLEYDKTIGGEDRRSGYVIPRELTDEEKEKFDVFTGTLKLRAEIIEEAKQVNN